MRDEYRQEAEFADLFRWFATQWVKKFNTTPNARKITSDVLTYQECGYLPRYVQS